MNQEVVTRIRLDTSSIPPAAAQASRAIGSISNAAQVSVGQTRNALRQLPAQFTDIATQLAGGQSIGLVLLQQGGQIRDAFGSVGGALRGVASVITPVRIALGGVAGVLGAVGLAAFQGAKESQGLRDTLILTGNAAGLTEARMTSLVDRISTTTGQTVGEVRELITTLAASGRVSGQVLESTATAVARVAELSGRNAADIAGQFTGLLRDPARVAAQLNDQYNFLNEAQARRIRQLADEGRKVEAANLVNQSLTDALDGQTRKLGSLERAWIDVRKAAASTFDFFKGFGRETATQDAIERSRALLAELRGQLADNLARGRGESAVGGQAPFNRGLREQISREEFRLASLAEKLRQENAAADAGAARAANAGTVGDILTGNPQRDREADRRATEAARRAQAAEAAMQRAFEANDRGIGRGFDEALRQSQAELLASAIDPVERNAEQQKFLDELLLANKRANIALISDDQARARATIELDRQVLQQRIEAVYQFGEDRTRAEAAADQARELALKQLASQRTRTLEDAVGSALTAGLTGRFDDIGKQWERLLLQMLAEAAKADLVFALFGKGSGGNLADLFGSVLGLFGLGGRAGGGSVNPRSAYLVGEQGPEVLVMGGRGGSIVPNAMLAGAGAGVFSPVTHVHIDSRTDAAQVAQVAGQAVRAAQEGMWQQLRARGLV